MNFQETVLDPGWWLDPTPSSGRWFLYFILIKIVGIIIFSLLIKYFFRPKLQVTLNLRNQWISLLNTCAILLLMLLFLHWQGFPWLGMRLLFGIVGVYFILKSVLILIYWRRGYRKKLIQESKEKILNKYK